MHDFRLRAKYAFSKKVKVMYRKAMHTHTEKKLELSRMSIPVEQPVYTTDALFNDEHTSYSVISFTHDTCTQYRKCCLYFQYRYQNEKKLFISICIFLAILKGVYVVLKPCPIGCMYIR